MPCGLDGAEPPTMVRQQSPSFSGIDPLVAAAKATATATASSARTKHEAYSPALVALPLLAEPPPSPPPPPPAPPPGERGFRGVVGDPADEAAPGGSAGSSPGPWQSARMDINEAGGGRLQSSAHVTRFSTEEDLARAEPPARALRIDRVSDVGEHVPHLESPNSDEVGLETTGDDVAAPPVGGTAAATGSAGDSSARESDDRGLDFRVGGVGTRRLLRSEASSSRPASEEACRRSTPGNVTCLELHEITMLPGAGNLGGLCGRRPAPAAVPCKSLAGVGLDTAARSAAQGGDLRCCGDEPAPAAACQDDGKKPGGDSAAPGAEAAGHSAAPPPAEAAAPDSSAFRSCRCRPPPVPPSGDDKVKFRCICGVGRTRAAPALRAAWPRPSPLPAAKLSARRLPTEQCRTASDTPPRSAGEPEEARSAAEQRPRSRSLDASTIRSPLIVGSLQPPPPVSTPPPPAPAPPTEHPLPPPPLLAVPTTAAPTLAALPPPLVPAAEAPLTAELAGLVAAPCDDRRSTQALRCSK